MVHIVLSWRMLFRKAQFKATFSHTESDLQRTILSYPLERIAVSCWCDQQHARLVPANRVTTSSAWRPQNALYCHQLGNRTMSSEYATPMIILGPLPPVFNWCYVCVNGIDDTWGPDKALSSVTTQSSVTTMPRNNMHILKCHLYMCLQNVSLSDSREDS